MKMLSKKNIFKKSLSIVMILLLLVSTYTPFIPSILTPAKVEAASNTCSATSGTSSSSTASSNQSAKIVYQPSVRIGGVALDQAATFLANMSDVTGAYYDQTLDRIVFVGKTDSTLPQFDKDDLSVAIKAVIFNHTIPALSIEAPAGSPPPSTLAVDYYGGIENTHFGQVLFDADYSLKHYLKGYDINNSRINSSVTSYKPITERYIDKNPGTGTHHNTSRWWIVPNLMSLKKDNNTNSFVFDTTTMKVNTEQLSSDNDPLWNQAADDFAQDFTNHYDQYAQETPVLQETKQLGKIVSVIKWLSDNNIATDFNWARDYAPKRVSTPVSVPTESVSQTYNGSSYTYYGGVAYDTANSYNTDTTGQSSGLKSAAQAVPTTKEDIHWTFLKDGQNYEAVAVAADAFRSIGSYNTTVSDMTFPTVGDVNLGFTRSYSSFSGGQYKIGRGWNFIPSKLYDNSPGDPVKIATCSLNNVSHLWKLAVDTPEGGHETFTYTSCENGFTPDESFYHTKLTAADDNSQFIATTKNQTQYIFDQNLRLTQIKDKNGNTITYGYDGNGNTTTVTDSKGHQLTINYADFSGQSLIANVTDWTGRKVEYNYDDQGSLLSVKDPNGNFTNYTYDTNFKLTSVTDREGTTVLNNTYTPEAKIATQTDAANITTTHNYDDVNKTVTVNDNLGRTQKVTYDTRARILQQTDQLLNSNYFTYGTEYSPLTVKDKKGNITTYTYDANGNVTSVMFPNNKTVNYQYDAKNRVTQVTDNRYGTTAKVTTLTYDANGNLVDMLEDSLAERKYDYDAFGSLLKYTDENNQYTTWTRDNFGNKLTETHFYDARTTHYTYNTLGRLTQQKDAENRETNYTYDANGNILTLSDGAGTTTNVFDKENRLHSKTQPNNAVTTFAYNPSGSLANVTDAMTNQTNYGYDGYQNLTSKQDSLNRQTQYLYDQMNRRTQTTTPLGNVAKWEYDANGNITKRTDEDNNVTTYQYDNLNRLTNITYPNSQTIVFTYDDRSNLTQMTDPTGITSYTYDRFDRLTQVQNSNGTVKYQYDLTGKLSKITYPDNKSVTYSYDSDNTLFRITDWNNKNTDFPRYNNGLPQFISLPNGITGWYTYDSANRLISLEYKQNTTSLAKFTYERDGVGNITKTTEEGSFFGTPTPTPTATPTPTPTATPTPTPTPGGSGVDLIITNITTNPASPSHTQAFTISTTVKNQGTVGISNKILKLGYYYDLSSAPAYTTSTNASQTVLLTLAPGASTTINYSGGLITTAGAHNIRALVDQGQAQTETNESNNAGGPTNITITSNGMFNQFLAYMGLHNLTDLFSIPTANAQVVTPQYINQYTYDALGRVTLASQSAVSKIFEYSYDSVGNRQTSKINGAISNYTYNNDNQLTAKDSTSYTYDFRGNQKTAGTNTYSYNYENRLTQLVNGGTTTQNVYDGKKNRLSQQVGSVTTQFVNDILGNNTKVLVAKNLSTGASNFFVQGPQTISEGDASITSRIYYLYDGLGNIRFTTDSSGNKLQTLAYDPYGNPLGSNGSGVFQYKGEQTDQAGLYFMRARYYDATTGRFISKDPVEGIIGNPQSQNGYNYANANPINLADPSGEFVGVDDAAVLLVGACVVGAGYVATNPTVQHAVSKAISGTISGISTLLDSGNGGSGGGGSSNESERNPKQDKKLTPGEIDRLQKGGEDIHDLKGGKGASRYDLYKDPDGNIYQKPKDGSGPGEETGLNINDY